MLTIWEADTLTMRPVASGAQCRAARAILGWSQTRLAVEAAVARKTITDFEADCRTIRRRTRRGITAVLERAGIEFIGEDGVRHHAVNPPLANRVTWLVAGITGIHGLV